MADESFIVVHELTEDFDLEKELFEDEVDLMMLSAVSCFMRRDLNRIQDYFELIFPSYRETPLVCCVLLCLFRFTRSNIRYVPSKCIRERSKCGNDGSIYQPWWLTAAVTKTSEESDAIFQNEGKLRGKHALYFLTFRSEWKKRSTSEGTLQFANGISGKLPYHLTSNRNFRIFLSNGKHPGSLLGMSPNAKLRDNPKTATKETDYAFFISVILQQFFRKIAIASFKNSKKCFVCV